MSPEGRNMVRRRRWGNVTVEYAIVLALIIGSAIGTIKLVGSTAGETLTKLGDALSSPTSGTGSPQSAQARSSP